MILSIDRQRKVVSERENVSNIVSHSMLVATKALIRVINEPEAIHARQETLRKGVRRSEGQNHIVHINYIVAML